jgi:ABC-type polysaccharide/polyol phosphate export permease
MTVLKLGRRSWRTILLGSIAFIAICYALLVVLEIPAADVLMLVIISVVIVLLLAFAGLLFAAIWHFFKKLWPR